MDLSGCESLKEIPNLSKATNLEYLNLSNCKNLVMLPSTIRNLKKLVTLNMEGCTRLEFLPNVVNLVSRNPFFNLSGCSRLRSFPQISTSITCLSLDLTAITEAPSWIENMSSLTSLTMKSCKKLKKVASNSFKLKRLLVVDYSDCERVTCFGDASAETHTTESQLPVTEEASFHLSYLIVCAKNCKSLQSISHYFLNPMSCLKFHNCFKLDRDARELILQSDFKYAVLPGGEVPTYFRHRAYGSSLTISLCKSSLSLKALRFEACIMLELLTLPEDHSAKITVQWYFRGKSNIHHVEIDIDSCHGDHLVMFHFELCSSKEVDGHPDKFDYDDVEFKFEYHSNACSCMRCTPMHYNKQTCPLSLQKIKGCGVRHLNVSPFKDGSGTSSETEYNQQYGDSDIESG